MKFKKYLALSLAVAMVATSAPQMAFMGLGTVEVKAAETTPTTKGKFAVEGTADITVDGTKKTVNVEVGFTTTSTGTSFNADSDKLSATYSGESIDPTPVITYKEAGASTSALVDSDNTLALKRDYTYSYVKYTDRGKETQKTEPVSSITDAGDYDIKITFNGEYSNLGTKRVQIKVNKAVVGNLKISSTNGIWKDTTDDNKEYYLVDADGKEEVPTLVVKAPDGKTVLKEGIDYKVESKMDTVSDGEKQVKGTATVTILPTSENIEAGKKEGINYCVVKTIKESDISIAISGTKDDYTVTPSVKGSDGSEWDYKIRKADTLDEVKEGDKITSGNYVLVVTGKVLGGYSETPVQKNFSISENTVEINDENTTIQYAGKDSYVYTGKEITPAVKVIYTDKETNVKKDITSSVDVVWSGNTKVSETPAVKVLGKGDYVGEVNKENKLGITFKIEKADFEDVDVSVASLDFNGEAQTPEVKQVYNGVDISDANKANAKIYACNIDETGEPKQVDGSWVKDKATATPATTVTNAGYYVAVVTATGNTNFNSAADKEVVFQVKPYDISNLKVVINDGKPLSSALTEANIKFFNGKDEFKMKDMPLAKGTDFEFTPDNGQAGNYTVTITGKDNYTGSLTASYVVNETIEDSNIHVYTTVDKDSEGNYVYTPHVNVYDNNYELIPASNYTVKYYTAAEPSKDAEAKEFAGTTTKYYAVVIPKGLYEGKKYSSYLDSYYTAKEFKVVGYDAAYDLNAAVIESIESVEYDDGKEIKPTLSVKSGTGAPVTETDNYDVVYSNNKDAGTATVTIYGKGSNYFGSTSTTFEITPKTLADLTASNITYGSKVKDSDIVKVGSTGLELDKDFKVTYAKAVLDKNGLYTYNKDGSYVTEGSYTADTIKDAGKYIAICEGVGNYKGTMQLPFDVNQLNLATLTVVFDSMNYTGNKVLPTFTATNGTDEIVLSPEDYVVETYTNSAATNPKDAVNPGKYYARVIAKDNGNLVDKTSGELFAIKAADLSKAKISVEAQTYTGEEIKPEISVTLDGNEVSSDLYEVTYADNIEVGTATVTVTAKGENVTGTVTESFKINAIDLSDATVSDISAKTYNGKKQKPDVTVTLDGKVLEEGEDFSVSYKNNTSAGKATVKVSGIGNYKGSVSKTFTINRAGQKITVKGTSKTYKVKTLKAKKATFKLSATAKGSVSFKKLSSGKKVTVSKNGTVTVAKGLKKGTYKIKVKATAAATKTNYKAASKTFTVKVVVK